MRYRFRVTVDGTAMYHSALSESREMGHAAGMAAIYQGINPQSDIRIVWEVTP